MNSKRLPPVPDALAYSRNYAIASPYLNSTAREHIEGLCDLLEQTEAARLAAVESAGALQPSVSATEGDRIAALERQLAEALESRAFTQQWYAERWKTLEDWFRSEGKDLPIRDQFWSILANGVKDANTPPTYAQQLNIAKHRAERAEKERAALMGGMQAVAKDAATFRYLQKLAEDEENPRLHPAFYVGKAEAYDVAAGELEAILTPEIRQLLVGKNQG